MNFTPKRLIYAQFGLYLTVSLFTILVAKLVVSGDSTTIREALTSPLSIQKEKENKSE